MRFVQAAQGSGADNQEGLYWRYEMAIRTRESRLRSVTGGNGGIYAVRREAYLIVDERMGHDLSLPFKLVKRGWRAVYVPGARASEKMVPSIDGEFARKRRMHSHAWPIVLRGGMLSPRGYGLLYGWMIASHRVLRYAAPAPARDRAGDEHRARRHGARSIRRAWRRSSRCCSPPRRRRRFGLGRCCSPATTC